MSRDTLHVQYDTDARQAELVRILTPVVPLLDRHHAALGDAPIVRFRSALARLRTRLETPFNLVVVGEFKRGKSTLVNALVGAELVSSDVTPETVAVQELHFGETAKTTVFLENGGRVELGPEVLRRDDVDALIPRLPSPIAHLRIEAPLESLRGMVVTDTPGTGDLMRRFEPRIQAYLPRADAVLYVVSALSPLSVSERTFLELTLRPMELAKVTFVLNLVDSLPSQADTDRVLERMGQKLSASFPDSRVLGVSALDAVMRQAGEGSACPERADELHARFEALRAHLDQTVLVNRDVLRLENGVRAALAALDTLGADLDALQGRLGQDHQGLQDAQRTLSGTQAPTGLADQLDALGAVHRTQAEQGERWLRGFVQRLMEQVLPDLEALDHDTVQKHLPFFLNERLRSAWTAVLESHRGALLEHLKTALSHSARLDRADSNQAGDAADGVAFHPPDLTDAAGVLVSLTLVTQFLAVPRLLLQGLMAAVGGVDRRTGDAQRAVRYRQHLTDALPELTDTLLTAHNQAGVALLHAAESVLRDAAETRRARALDATEQALAAHAQGAQAIAAQRAVVATVAGQLPTLRARILELHVDA